MCAIWVPTVGSTVRVQDELMTYVKNEGTNVVLRSLTSRLITTMSFVEFVTVVKQANPAHETSMVTGVDLLAPEERDDLEKLVRQLAWIINPVDDPDAPAQVEQRVAAVAEAMGVSTRTVRRKLKRFRESGANGLVSGDVTRRRAFRTDQRWTEIAREVVGEQVRQTTSSRKNVMWEINLRFRQECGDEAELPSQSTRYRRLEDIAKGAGTFASTKRRASVADAPKTAHGQMDITRPGQLVVLDSHRIDILVVVPKTRLHEDIVTRVELAAGMDYGTRTIVGVVTSPYNNRVDVGNVIMQACSVMPAPEEIPEEAAWRYRGVPQQISVPAGEVWGMPYVGPEAILTDRGKPYVSEHVVSVCQELGISVYTAQPYKPTDKAVLERFFGTLISGLISMLPGYVGSDPTLRGLNVDKEDLLTIHELDNLIRQWICTVYHHNKQSGLTFAGMPQRDMSPAEMYEASIACHGLPRLLVRPGDWIKFLPKVARTIQHYGVQWDNRIYDGLALDAYRHRQSTEPRVRRPDQFRFAYDVNDIRKIYFQDPETNEIHTLWWTQARGLDAPFSDAMMQLVRAIGAEDLPDSWMREREFLEAVLPTIRKDRQLRSRVTSDGSRLPEVMGKLAEADKEWARIPLHDELPPIEDEPVDDLDDPDGEDDVFDDFSLLAIADEDDEWAGAVDEQ
ncbi:DDE-type integrase/transposase/recombinase [Dietzia sp. DQ12-76]|nr:DDE-type integrase/transposase/recombinase [Dietzia sp. DQ12-76]MBB1029052.1 DDE-type integrase/transposase/recombinase [Dietzia sp. DQ11-38-2]